MIVRRMHVFAVVAGAPEFDEATLKYAVAGVACEFLLDPGTSWQAVSSGGRVRAVGMHHSAEAAAPRRYLAREGSTLVWFDGLPVDARGEYEAADAGELARRWDGLPERLEGQFLAVRLDLDSDSVEFLTDTLGLLPLYLGRRDNGTVVSNSAGLVASLLGLRAPDELALTSMVALGWAVGRRTLIEGVGALPGGALHRLDASGLTSRSHYSPAEIVARCQRRGRARPNTMDIALDLVRVTGSAVRSKTPITAPLTAGHDTRLMLALGLRTSAPIAYYTGAHTGDADVTVAQRLAQEFRLEHRVDRPEERERPLGIEAAERFVSQNDGLITLHQLPDYIELDRPVPRLGVTMWGIGGEIARAGGKGIYPLAPNLPIFSRLVGVQRRLMARKVDNHAGLLTPRAQGIVLDYVDRFIDQRRTEGWPTREVSQAFYTFERSGCWGATGPRRAAIAGDVFSPFATRVFIDYSFSLSPAERYLEAAHYRLLGALSVAARDSPFEVPFAPQRRHRVALMATRRLINVLRRPDRGHDPAALCRGAQQTDFVGDWYERHIDHVRELFAAAQPALWETISQERLEELLTGPPEQRAYHLKALLRATTAAWYLDLRARSEVAGSSAASPIDRNPS